MTGLTEVKQVDDSLLQGVVKRIVKSVNPEKIILFGSYAYGKPHEESDLDILVVMDFDLSRYKRSVPIYRALAGLLIPKDVLVHTPEEIEAWKDVPQAFITTIVKKGKVIYEKKSKACLYPEFEEPLLEDAKEAVQVAEKVRDFVLGRLPEEISK